MPQFHLNPSNNSTPHASMQTSSLVVKAPTPTIYVNPGRTHNNSHALNSYLPVRNNNEGSINLKTPSACHEIVPPVGEGLPSPFQVLSAATIGITKKGRRMSDNVKKSLKENGNKDGWVKVGSKGEGLGPKASTCGSEDEGQMKRS